MVANVAKGNVETDCRGNWAKKLRPDPGENAELR